MRLVTVLLFCAAPRIAFADCISAFDCFCGYGPVEQLVEVSVLSANGVYADLRIESVEPVMTSSVVLAAGQTIEGYGRYNDAQAGDRFLAYHDGTDLQLLGRIEDGKVSCAIDEDFTPSVAEVKSVVVKPYAECRSAVMALGQEEIACDDTPFLCGCSSTRAARSSSVLAIVGLLALLSVRRLRTGG